MEEWKTIADAPNYMVSSLGRLKRSPHKTKSKNRFGDCEISYGEKIIKAHKTNKGYMSAALFVNGRYVNFLVHREVAKAFLPNPNGYPCINHKDVDKANNAVDNLEWCTYTYNNHYDGRIDKMRHTFRKNRQQVKRINTKK